MVNRKQRQRQREKRREKRRLKYQLKVQGSTTTNEIPIGKYEMLDRCFMDYAVNETKRELRNRDIEPEREVLIRKVINLRNKLNPSERRV